jgi:hypothetical protein
MPQYSYILTLVPISGPIFSGPDIGKYQKSGNTRYRKIPNIGKYQISGNTRYREIPDIGFTKSGQISDTISGYTDIVSYSISGHVIPDIVSDIVPFLEFFQVPCRSWFSCCCCCCCLFNAKKSMLVRQRYELDSIIPWQQPLGPSQEPGPWLHSRPGLHSRPQPQSRLLPHSRPPTGSSF